MTLSANDRRLLLVHAHPDDESITTGGTIARYLDEGAAVTVVTCTLGEQGEVMEPRFAELTADHSDQLGGYRFGELRGALAALSAPGAAALSPRFLGGIGRWRDSGMVQTASTTNPRAFATATCDRLVPGGPVDALVAVIREIKPQVVVTYDPFGGYGHPDHIAAHTATAAAVAAAGDPELGDGEPWAVSKLYWTVLGRGQFDAATAELATTDLPDGWLLPTDETIPTHDDATITTVIDVSAVAERKANAMRAHQTQLEVSPDGAAFVLTNRIVQPILDQELFIIVRGAAAPGPDGVERDLFAGLS